MNNRWLSSAGTQEVLDECGRILAAHAVPCDPQSLQGNRASQGDEGRLVFVMGDPRSGASAVAKQLAQLARRKGVTCLAVGEAPWGGNMYLRTHVLRSLEVPLLCGEFQTGDLASKPYAALLAHRPYQAIIVDDGHDYFVRTRYVSMSNLDALIQLAGAQVPRQVFVFGISNILAPVALAAEERGVEVVQISLPTMANNQRYRQFVEDVLSNHRPGGVGLPELDIDAVHSFTKGSVARTVDVISDIAYGSPWVSPLLVPQEIFPEHSIPLRAIPGHVTRGQFVPYVAPAKGIQESPIARSTASTPPCVGKAFAGMVKPIVGESLSSWLSRNAASPHIPHVHSEFLDACARIAKIRTGGDLDRLYEHDAFLSLFPERARYQLTKAFTLPTNICSFESSLNYCPQCLLEDVRAMRAPAWRSEWRRRGNCLCERHGRLILLQELTTRSKDEFHRGWLAFSQHANTGTFVLGNHFVQRITSLCESNPMEQRLCRLVRRMAEWVSAAPDFPTYGRPSKHCIRFLMGFFLYRPFDHCKGGLARWFLGSQRNRIVSDKFRFPSALELDTGIETASPRDLALTYLLIGSAFNLISLEDIELVNRALYFTNTPYPENLLALRALARCFTEPNLNKFKQSARKNLAPGDLSHLEWLFSKDKLQERY